MAARPPSLHGPVSCNWVLCLSDCVDVWRWYITQIKPNSVCPARVGVVFRRDGPEHLTSSLFVHCSATWPDSGEKGSGADCDDEEDCEDGSGFPPVGPVFTPKTTTDDIIILNSTVPPDDDSDTTDSLIITVNITETPPKKGLSPFSTPQSSKTPNASAPSGGGGKGDGDKKDRNGSYGEDPYEKRSKNPMGLNIGLIVGIAAGVVLLLLILAYALYKYKSRDEGSYKIDESKNYSYEAYTAQAAKQPATPHANGGMSKSSAHSSKPRKKDVKEWYVWCTVLLLFLSQGICC